jgi:hypothetical protein
MSIEKEIIQTSMKSVSKEELCWNTRVSHALFQNSNVSYLVSWKKGLNRRTLLPVDFFWERISQLIHTEPSNRQALVRGVASALLVTLVALSNGFYVQNPSRHTLLSIRAQLRKTRFCPEATFILAITIVWLSINAGSEIMMWSDGLSLALRRLARNLGCQYWSRYREIPGSV